MKFDSFNPWMMMLTPTQENVQRYIEKDGVPPGWNSQGEYMNAWADASLQNVLRSQSLKNNPDPFIHHVLGLSRKIEK